MNHQRLAAPAHLSAFMPLLGTASAFLSLVAVGLIGGVSFAMTMMM